MKKVLKEKLWDYIVKNNPELMYELQEVYAVEKYLEGRIKSMLPLITRLQEDGRTTKEICAITLRALTQPLKPSRYLYLENLIAEEFPQEYRQQQNAGLLTDTILVILTACDDVFQAFSFSEETLNNQQLKHALIVKTSEGLLSSAIIHPSFK